MTASAAVPAFALSLGLAGSVPAEVVRQAARAAEQAGLHALWLNDTPAGDALAGLAAAAEVTTTLRLATGVIPSIGAPPPRSHRASRSSICRWIASCWGSDRVLRAARWVSSPRAWPSCRRGSTCRSCWAPSGPRCGASVPSEPTGCC
ncbi:LLM class flavin-dependent oxidoreductase [Homoserinibacter gongjuensis]|uniref:LLM class flavin-dependent oxidoreductase n=1 Tax=Homoserinibacter gongjuensis TaxID=1162968 RepID=UPI0024E10E74|nr:LLM class flavin-dependent oxidoreductase [Homoserinibacter gongjuensis]